MFKKKVVIALTLSAISVAIALCFLLLPRESGEWSPSPPQQGVNEVADLGMTYLTVTPTSSACYDLEADSGVLVTEVISGSPIDQASVPVQAGDVILSYNGTKLDKGVSLLCLMRQSPADEEIVLEICRGKSCYSVECCASCGTPDCICQHSTPSE